MIIFKHKYSKKMGFEPIIEFTNINFPRFHFQILNLELLIILFFILKGSKRILTNYIEKR